MIVLRIFNETEITNEFAQQNGMTIKSEENGVHKLVIEKLSSSSAGSYKLVAKNLAGTVQTTSSALEIDTLPRIVPNFQVENITPESATVIEEEHKSLDLGFVVSGKPEPTVEYYKDEVKFKPTEKRVVLSKKEAGVYRLEMTDMKPSDGGIYKLVCKNTCGEAQFVIDLKIKSAPSFVKTFKNSVECVEGTKLELVGVIGSSVYPNPEFQWLQNGELIDEANLKETVILKDQFASSLIIENVNLSLDGTKFKLKSFNEFGACETETRVDVLSVPKFVQPLEDAQPLLNQSFEWAFSIDSSPEPKIKVLKNDKEWNLSKETRVKLAKEMETAGERKIFKYKLQFANMTADDIAAYQVEASNKAGEAKSSGKLVVIGAPCFIRKPADTSVTLSKPIKIDCEIAGIPIPNIAWFKDGQPLVENDRVKVENKLKTTFILTFKNCLKEDAGVYTVKLDNESGTAEALFNLTVQGSLIRIQIYKH